MKNKITGHIAAAITLVLWGTTFIMSKKLSMFFTATQILLMRFVLAYVVLWIISAFDKRTKLKVKCNCVKDELMFVIAGCCGLSLEALFEILSMKYTYTANTSVIVSTNPFFIGLASMLFLRDKTDVKLNFFIGFTLALFGAAIISFNGAEEFGLNPFGDILALVSAITWAIYTVLITKLADKTYSNIFITRRVYFWGVVSMVICNLFSHESFNFGAAFVYPNYLLLIFLGVFASALGFIFWNFATKSISPVGASIYLYLTPVISVIAGAIFLKEQFNLTSIVGILVVISGTALSSIKKN